MKDVSVFWEPGAPLPRERIHCLWAAYSRGFKTSVSIEPMLGGAHETALVISAIRTIVTDTIWIGKMNKTRLRVDMNNPANQKAVEDISKLQSDSQIIELYSKFKDDPLIRWKDSIKSVIGKQTR